VVYTIDTDELVLIGIRVGSHDRLFPGQNRAKRYRKNDK
jgi:mRNA interferase YafQ